MPFRSPQLATGEYYHIFNRGLFEKNIFIDATYHQRFLRTLTYYHHEGPKPRFSLFDPRMHTLHEGKNIAQLICYCLMPNHFHLLLKQEQENGILECLSRTSNSYAKYFNTRRKRKGPLFEGEFKSVFIESNEQLLHVSRYIHLNPLVTGVTDHLDAYPWSSFREYIGKSEVSTCEKQIILGQFDSPASYEKFVLDQADYARELEFIKHHLIDD